ncbi:HAD-IB family phosphatase [Candidatus Dojkabacteria bacterium]|nr:HAD-IB family phosphatase [Candidatus Dojkabacteria bacterium]
MQKLAFFDLDKTIYRRYSLEEVRIHLRRNFSNLKWSEKEEKKITKSFQDHKSNYNETVNKLLDLTASMLKNFREDEIDNLYRDIFKNSHKEYYSWVELVFDFLNQNDWVSYLITGSLKPAAYHIVQKLKFEEIYASEFEIKNNKYTSKIIKIVNDKAKAIITKSILEEYPDRLTIGFGDSLGDIPMLELVDIPFIIDNKKEYMLNLAQSRNWTVTQKANTIIKEIKKIF